MRDKLENIENCDELEDLAEDLTIEELEELDQAIQAIRNQNDKEFLEFAEELSTDGLTTAILVTIACYNCSESYTYEGKDWQTEDQAMNAAAENFDSDFVEIDNNYYCNSCYEDMVSEGKADAINELIEEKKEEIEAMKAKAAKAKAEADAVMLAETRKQEMADRWKAINEKREHRVRERITYGLAAIDAVIQGKLKSVYPKTVKSSLTEKQLEWITTVYSTPWHEYEAYRECK